MPVWSNHVNGSQHMLPMHACSTSSKLFSSEDANDKSMGECFVLNQTITTKGGEQETCLSRAYLREDDLSSRSRLSFFFSLALPLTQPWATL